MNTINLLLVDTALLIYLFFVSIGIGTYLTQNLRVHVRLSKSISLADSILIGYIVFLLSLSFPILCFSICNFHALKEFYLSFLFVTIAMSVLGWIKLLGQRKLRTSISSHIGEIVCMLTIMVVLSILVYSQPVNLSWDVVTVHLKNALGYIQANSIPYRDPYGLCEILPASNPLSSIMASYFLIVTNNNSFGRIVSVFNFAIVLFSVRGLTQKIIFPEKDEKNSQFLFLGGIFLSLPLVIVFSGVWGMYPDSIAVALSSVALYFLSFDNKYFRALAFPAVGLAFLAKVQMLLLIPLTLAFFTHNKYWRTIMIFFSVVPSLIVGWTWGRLLNIFDITITFILSSLFTLISLFLNMHDGEKQNIRSVTQMRFRWVYIVAIGILLPLLWFIRNGIYLRRPFYPWVPFALWDELQDAVMFQTRMWETFASNILTFHSFCELLPLIFTSTVIGSPFILAKVFGFLYMLQRKGRALTSLSLLFYTYLYVLYWSTVIRGIYDSVRIRYFLPLLPIVLVITLIGFYEMEKESPKLTYLYFLVSVFLSLRYISIDANNALSMRVYPLHISTDDLLLAFFALAFLFPSVRRKFQSLASSLQKVKVAVFIRGRVVKKPDLRFVARAVAFILTVFLASSSIYPRVTLLQRIIQTQGDHDLLLMRETNFHQNYYEVISFLKENADSEDAVLAFQDVGISVCLGLRTIDFQKPSIALKRLLTAETREEFVNIIKEYSVKWIVLPGPKNFAFNMLPIMLRNVNSSFLEFLKPAYARTLLISEESPKLPYVISVPEGSWEIRLSFFLQDLGNNPWDGIGITIGNTTHAYLIEVRNDGNLALLYLDKGKRGDWITCAHHGDFENKEVTVTIQYDGKTLHASAKSSNGSSSLSYDLSSAEPLPGTVLSVFTQRARVCVKRVEVYQLVLLQAPFEKFALEYWSIYMFKGFH